MFRYRPAQIRFERAEKPSKCPFCAIEGAGPVVRETEYVRITKAKYEYDLWEFRNVTDHLLILPKRHVHSLAELNPAERAEVIDIMAEFEAQNYNVYARALKSVQRTEIHQHTHLIKTSDKHPKAALYVRTPHVVVKI